MFRRFPGAPVEAQSPTVPTPRAFVERYCLDCHNSGKTKGKLDLDAVSSERVVHHPEVWKKVVGKLRARKIPPEGPWTRT